MNIIYTHQRIDDLLSLNMRRLVHKFLSSACWKDCHEKNAWSNIYLIAHDAFDRTCLAIMLYTILEQQIHTCTFRQAQNCFFIINANNDLPVDVICKGKVEPTKCTKILLRDHHLDIEASLDLIIRAPGGSI